MKKLLVFSALAGTFFIYSCGGGDQKPAAARHGLRGRLAATLPGQPDPAARRVATAVRFAAADRNGQHHFEAVAVAGQAAENRSRR